MSVSAFAIMELAKPYTEQVLVWLLEVSHPTVLPAPFRFCRASQDVVSRGETYSAWGFDIVLPDERSDELPQAKLIVGDLTTFDDGGAPESFWTLIEQRIPIELGPLRIKVEMVFESDLDTPNISHDGYRWLNPQKDRTTVNGDLLGAGFLLDGVQAKNRRMTPGNLPGLFI